MSAILILVVAIVGLIVYGIDQGLSAGIGGLKQLATGEDTSVSETVGDEHDHDHETEEETAESEKTTEADAETTEAVEEKEEATEEAKAE